nr:hypothetical protein GCM10020093_115910 [Planobispora longispora]
MRDAVTAVLGPAPVSGDLAALRPLLLPRLGGLVSGIGFIAAPGLLSDAPWYLEWWQESSSGDPVRLVRDMDPASSAFYDYSHWDWFSGPRSGEDRTLAGPYVDFLCTDEYSLTLSVPVLRGGGRGSGESSPESRRPTCSCAGSRSRCCPCCAGCPARRSWSTGRAGWWPPPPPGTWPDRSSGSPRDGGAPVPGSAPGPGCGTIAACPLTPPSRPA